MTLDFLSTVVSQTGKPRDEYSRPVHWVLWSQVTDTALICGDYEANAILPAIQCQDTARTHLIVYTAPITRIMVMFDTLQFYTIPHLPNGWHAPTWLVRDLGIFAGRLYFDFQEQSHALYPSLGLPQPASAVQNAPTELDLWQELPFDDAPKGHREPEPFSPSPLLFMQEWLAVRRKGQDFSQTMMGELCRGRRLEIEQEARSDTIQEVGGE